MARKKIKKTTKTVIASGKQSIGYQGRLTVSLQHGNKIISSKEYHNNGMPNLFKFLANNIAGSYNEVLRPVKIKLFRFPHAEDDATNPDHISVLDFVWSRCWETESGLVDKPPVPVSPYILYDTAPVVRKVANEGVSTPTVDDYHYETTFHFRIPFSYISDNTIHAVGFYPNNAISEANDVSAYYLFTNDAGTEWDPLILTDVVGNFSIVIDWTMSVSNK